MKMILIPVLAFASLGPALAGPAMARDLVVETEMRSFPVAYEALSTGNTNAAITELEAGKGLAHAHDPSRLINLGTAYARKGRFSEARAMYQAAIRSHTRYDLELANGQMMDSRDAARLALKTLSDRQIASR